MTPRELAGHVNRAKACFIYVDYSSHEDGAMWLEVTKVKAKEIVDDARDSDVEEIAAHVAKGEVYIGDPDDFPEEEGGGKDAPGDGPG